MLGKPLCHQGKELQVDIWRLHDVRGDKIESDLSSSEILGVQKPEPRHYTERGTGKTCACWAGKSE